MPLDLTASERYDVHLSLLERAKTLRQMSSGRQDKEEAALLREHAVKLDVLAKKFKD